MISSDDEQSRLSEHSRQEMVTRCKLRPKLVRGINRRIHVPAKPFLGRGERMNDVLEWRVANY
jgi:hypothetical protein